MLGFARTTTMSSRAWSSTFGTQLRVVPSIHDQPAAEHGRAARSCPPRRPREEGAAVAGGEQHERAPGLRSLSFRQQHVATSMLRMILDRLREAAAMRGFSSM